MNIKHENMVMINDIMNHDYRVESVGGYTKLINNKFDIFIKSNSSIVVIDKRNNYQQPTVYKDLKTAHINLIKA